MQPAHKRLSTRQVGSWIRATLRTPWISLPLVAAVIFVIAASGAAIRETPTVDEFAHVPAGVLHWRLGQFELYRNNPPLGKMWVALPLALDPRVKTLPYAGEGVGWDPWVYGQKFEQAQRDNYLSLMTRARLMTIPLVLLCGVMVYAWSKALFGPFAGALSAALFLLSPTVLAHGHLATVDIATMVTIAAAVFALRWWGAAPSGTRSVLAGGALGLAMAVKFSALYLPPLMILLGLAIAWPTKPTAASWKRLAAHGVLYTLSAWFVLNATMGFSGTFDTVGSLRPRSQSLRTLTEKLPASMPLLLPRAYVTGIDALKEDMDHGDFTGYLHGQWSLKGIKSYYFITYAIKESEPIVLLTVLSLVAIAVVRPPRRELLLLVLPPAVFLFIAAVLNSLCLGIRYVLPVFPFLFVLMGSCFAWAERRLAATEEPRARWDRRWWLAGPLLGYAVALCIAVFPSYLGYFNQFVGGSSQGANWLLDSNLDWGQDLYRLPALSKKYDVDRWRLLYFGHVDPATYGIDYELSGTKPEFACYAVSANYWKQMPYAVLSAEGEAIYVADRAEWTAPLIPTEMVGSLAIFDLREAASNKSSSAAAKFNAGIVRLTRGEADQAVASFRQAIERDPALADAHLYLGVVLNSQRKTAEAIESLRRAVQLRPNWDLPLNGLAWLLATGDKSSSRDRNEAVELAERACNVAGRENLNYLKTLAVAYAAAGRFDAAMGVCDEALILAGTGKTADEFRGLRAEFEGRRQPPGSGP